MEHLYNYTPLPSEKIRRKINYFMTPYNNSVIHEKFMNFKYLDQNDRRNIEEVANKSKYHWNQISDFILNKDLELLDQTLNSVNDGLYRVLENKMRDEPSFHKKKIKKGIKCKDNENPIKVHPVLLDKYKVDKTPIACKFTQIIVPKRSSIIQNSLDTTKYVQNNEQRVQRRSIKNKSKAPSCCQNSSKFAKIQNLFKHLIMDKKRENELYYSQIMSKPNYKSSSLQSRNQNKRAQSLNSFRGLVFSSTGFREQSFEHGSSNETTDDSLCHTKSINQDLTSYTSKANRLSRTLKRGCLNRSMDTSDIVSIKLFQ